MEGEYVDYPFWMSECFKTGDMNGVWFWMDEMIKDMKGNE